jgi:hypothetical protein
MTCGLHVTAGRSNGRHLEPARTIFGEMKIFSFIRAKHFCHHSSFTHSAIIKTQTQIRAMDLSQVLIPPPSTPPPEQQDEIIPEAEQLQQDDVGEEQEEEMEEEEEEEEDRPRKMRGRRKWEVLRTWDRTALLDTEINADILQSATEKMEQSGLVEWPAARTSQKTLGLWTLLHSYRRDSGHTDVECYACPLHNRCACPVQIRVSRNATRVWMEYSGGEHTQARCHQVDRSKKLNFKQRIAVAKVVKVNPAATSGDVRMALQRLSPSGKVQPGLARSVRSVVKLQKKMTFCSMAGGQVVTNSFASIAALGERLWFGDILRKHNSGEHHFSDPHEVFCIGNVAPEAAGEEIFLNLATVWSILNLARGLASGWPNTLCGDGTGKVSKYQVTMVSFGINSIPAKFNTLNYCIGPVENCDIFVQSWEGVSATWYSLMNDWKCCPMSYEDCRVCALISQFKIQADVAKSLQTKELIHKAKSDNTDHFRNFAATIGALPLTCDVHGSGVVSQFLISSWYFLSHVSPQLFRIILDLISSILRREGRCMMCIMAT